MKTVKKNVYYCDFCKKKGLAKHHMIKHETHCTANPDRKCRVCCVLGNNVISKDGVKDFLRENLPILNSEAIFEAGKFVNGVKFLSKLRVKVDGCPACMLSVLRINEIDISFDYKEECSAFWDEENLKNDGCEISINGNY